MELPRSGISEINNRRFFYVERGGERRGPIDAKEFAEFVKQGVILPDTLVWNDESAEWVPAWQILPLLRASVGKSRVSISILEILSWVVFLIWGVGGVAVLILLVVSNSKPDSSESLNVTRIMTLGTNARLSLAEKQGIGGQWRGEILKVKTEPVLLRDGTKHEWAFEEVSTQDRHTWGSNIQTNSFLGMPVGDDDACWIDILLPEDKNLLGKKLKFGIEIEIVKPVGRPASTEEMIIGGHGMWGFENRTLRHTQNFEIYIRNLVAEDAARFRRTRAMGFSLTGLIIFGIGLGILIKRAGSSKKNQAGKLRGLGT